MVNIERTILSQHIGADLYFSKRQDSLYSSHRTVNFQVGNGGSGVVRQEEILKSVYLKTYFP